MRLTTLLLFLPLWGVASAQPTRIVVTPVVNTAPCKFAGPDVKQTHDIMAAAVTEFLAKSIEATDYLGVTHARLNAALDDHKLDFTKSGHRNKEKLQQLGKAVDANYAVLILVEWTDQKNPELRAVASNPALAKSTNRVRARIWLLDVAEDRLLIDGSKQTIEGESKGPYFGTVDTRDLSGDPTAKGAVISNEYRQRAKWLGRALVAAVKSALQPALGLKDPPPTS